MTPKIIDLEITPLTLDALLDELADSPEVLLIRGGDLVARVAAADGGGTGTPRVLGLHEGEGWISDDFTDELSNSFWLGEG